MKFDVFGTIVEITDRQGSWQTFYPGQDGKKRPAVDITIPADVTAAELEQYLADLRHEYATVEKPEVLRIE